MTASIRRTRSSAGINSCRTFDSVGSGPKPPATVMRKPFTPSRIIARSQTHVRQHVQQIRDPRQRHKMILNVLASGQVALAPRELIGDASHLAHLIGSQQPAGNLGPDHMDVRLALAIHTATEALWT